MRIPFTGRAVMTPLLAGTLLLTWIAPLAAHGPGVLEACVKRSNGDMRLVHPGDACRHNEKRVKWNVAGPAGPAGSPVTGPPYVWICTPAHYPLAGSNTRADVYVFNGGSAAANVAVNILDRDGNNLAGVTIPGSSPAETYPGETGSATVSVLSANTRNVTWVMPQTVPDAVTSVAFTVRVCPTSPSPWGPTSSSAASSRCPAASCTRSPGRGSGR